MAHERHKQRQGRKQTLQKKPGAPPGTIIFTGEQKMDRPQLRYLHYDSGACGIGDLVSAEECHDFLDSGGVTWVSMAGLQDTQLLEGIGRVFGLHPLIMEDVANPHQRPKCEEYDGLIYLVMKSASIDPVDDDLVFEQVSLILGRNFVLTFEESEKGNLEPVRDRICKGKGKIRSRHADYLLYALVDTLVDRFFEVLDDLGEAIERLEEQVLLDPGEGPIGEIHQRRHHLLQLRKSVWPLREVISSLSRDESDLIDEGTRLYFRDVHDHTLQIVDTIETSRDLLTGILDLYMSSISNRMNEVMKVLTIFASIFIPLTFMAGLYGMNFEHMPELKLPWAYPALLVTMVLIAGVMLHFFHRKKWI